MLITDRQLCGNLEKFGKSQRIYKNFDIESLMAHMHTDIMIEKRKLLVSGKCLFEFCRTQILLTLKVSARDFLRDETRKLVRDKLFKTPNVKYHASDFQIMGKWAGVIERQSV